MFVRTTRQETSTVSPLRRKRVATGIALLLGLSLTACSSATGDDGSGINSSTNADLQTVKVGSIPTLGLGLLKVGEQQGFFADEGLQLDITPVDSGPTVITGLVAGQYDVAYTAYAPPLLAIAGGQDLRLVYNLGGLGPKGTNGAIVVAKDSAITSWKDLAGAKLGINAPRSVLVLWAQAAIAADGGDASGLELTPLPFNQIADNVASGKLDAGFLVEPYLTQALAKQGDKLRSLGDPAAATFAEGSPGAGVITSASTAENNAELITKFTAAMDKTVAYGNEHLDEVRTAGADLVGLSSEDAEKIYLGSIDPQINAADFEPLVTAMKKFGWVTSDIDLGTFVNQ
ncbi:MAG TPA: hypothetical protein DCM67_05525 [Propionibacteriaceae bacterium]|nr:hypothetical protein [Propionibacteriaceae bacterium]